MNWNHFLQAAALAQSHLAAHGVGTGERVKIASAPEPDEGIVVLANVILSSNGWDRFVPRIKTAEDATTPTTQGDQQRLDHWRLKANPWLVAPAMLGVGALAGGAAGLASLFHDVKTIANPARLRAQAAEYLRFPTSGASPYPHDYGPISALEALRMQALNPEKVMAAAGYKGPFSQQQIKEIRDIAYRNYANKFQAQFDELGEAASAKVLRNLYARGGAAAGVGALAAPWMLSTHSPESQKTAACAESAKKLVKKGMEKKAGVWTAPLIGAALGGLTADRSKGQNPLSRAFMGAALGWGAGKGLKAITPMLERAGVGLRASSGVRNIAEKDLLSGGMAFKHPATGQMIPTGEHLIQPGTSKGMFRVIDPSRAHRVTEIGGTPLNNPIYLGQDEAARAMHIMENGKAVGIAVPGEAGAITHHWTGTPGKITANHTYQPANLLKTVEPPTQVVTDLAGPGTSLIHTPTTQQVAALTGQPQLIQVAR